MTNLSLFPSPSKMHAAELKFQQNPAVWPKQGLGPHFERESMKRIFKKFGTHILIHFAIADDGSDSGNL